MFTHLASANARFVFIESRWDSKNIPPPFLLHRHVVKFHWRRNHYLYVFSVLCFIVTPLVLLVHMFFSTLMLTQPFLFFLSLLPNFWPPLPILLLLLLPLLLSPAPLPISTYFLSSHVFWNIRQPVVYYFIGIILFLSLYLKKKNTLRHECKKKEKKKRCVKKGKRNGWTFYGKGSIS